MVSKIEMQEMVKNEQSLALAVDAYTSLLVGGGKREFFQEAINEMNRRGKFYTDAGLTHDSFINFCAQVGVNYLIMKFIERKMDD